MAVGWNKVTLFFSDGKYSWTEQYWSPVQEDLPATQARAVRLCNVRKLILGGGQGLCVAGGCNQPQLVYVRISQLGMRRYTLFMNPNGQVLAQPPTNASLGKMIGAVPSANPVSSEPPDNPYSCVGMVCNMVGGGKSKRQIGGLPDAYICDQAVNPNDPVATFIQQFGAYLTTEPWGGLAVLGPDNQRTIPQVGSPPANPSLAGAVAILDNSGPTKGVTQNQFGQPVITLTAPMTFAGNCCTQNRLSITCYIPMPGTPTLNGTYAVSPVGGGPTVTTFTIKKVFKPLVPFCAGFAVPYNPQVLAFEAVAITGPTKRDRGVIPFNRPRGRSRKRA